MDLPNTHFFKLYRDFGAGLVLGFDSKDCGKQGRTLMAELCIGLSDTSQQRSSAFATAILAFVAVFGIFNRITFPAFLIIPGLRLIPHFRKK